MAEPGARSVQQGGASVPTADGRSIELSLSEHKGKTLSEILKADTVVSGRVVERFQNDTYLVNIRGQHIVAESTLPLLRDSIVKLAVLGTEGGLRLRIAKAGGNDHAFTSAPAQRLAALGLPNTPSAQLILQSFEDVGAQLTPPQRLQQAFLSLSEAQRNGATPAQQQHLASAHATLATAKLPATPALLNVAQRAVQGQQNRIAQTLKQLLPQAQQLVRPNKTAAQVLPSNNTLANKLGTSVPPVVVTTTPTANSPNLNKPRLGPGVTPGITPGVNHSETPSITTGKTADIIPSSNPITATPATPATPVTHDGAQLKPNIAATPSPNIAASPQQQLVDFIHQHDLGKNAKQAFHNALRGLGIVPAQPEVSAQSQANNGPVSEPSILPSNVINSGLTSIDELSQPPAEVELGSLLRRMVEISRSLSTKATGVNSAQTIAREVLSRALLPPRLG